MIDRIAFLWPEISLFTATCVVLVAGLSPSRAARTLCAPVCGLGLVAAGVLAWWLTPAADDARAAGFLLPALIAPGKVAVAAVGLLLLLIQAGTVGAEEDRAGAHGAFDPARTNRPEFYSFFLFSLTGLMLCLSADDLIWLFLALELTSLPTYVMVGIGSRSGRAHEAAVKYFFLGALGAAVFLYGFALVFGGTGSTRFAEIALEVRSGGLNDVALLGLLMAALGVAFKVAAVPMHFYTPDVYQGAAAPVGAFLAFVPKAAGFAALMNIAAMAGWHHGEGGASLPEALRMTLWVIAALTMTWGNVLAILQSNVKRILAYSSIAHSGYMLVGVVAGPGETRAAFADNGLAAVVFYMGCYGVMNTGAFAVLACLERRGPGGEGAEIEEVEDLRGLWRTHPILAVVMAACCLSLLGMPPLLGFFGKVPLLTSAISAGEVPLAVVLAVNSAIAAFYYLRLVFAPWLDEPARPAPRATAFATRPVAAMLAAGGVVGVVFVAGPLMRASRDAAMLSSAGRGEPSGASAAGVVESRGE